MLPVLKTGETVIVGEATNLPMRCRVTLPSENYQPKNIDPKVSEKWSNKKRIENYDHMVASCRAQNPQATIVDIEQRELDVSVNLTKEVENDTKFSSI